MSLTDLEARDLQWRKARRSAGNGACVEVAHANGQIFIRDTKNTNGPVLAYPTSAWCTFLDDAKRVGIG